MNFKIFFLFTGLLFFNQAISQVTAFDLGKKKFDDVVNLHSNSPCELIDKRVLTYCVEDGSKISYVFKNQILQGIMYMTAYSSKYAAERELEIEITKNKASLGIIPNVINGKAIFDKLESPIFMTLSVEYFNQKYYLVNYVAKK